MSAVSARNYSTPEEYWADVRRKLYLEDAHEKWAKQEPRGVRRKLAERLMKHTGNAVWPSINSHELSRQVLHGCVAQR